MYGGHPPVQSSETLTLLQQQLPPHGMPDVATQQQQQPPVQQAHATDGTIHALQIRHTTSRT